MTSPKRKDREKKGKGRISEWEERREVKFRSHLIDETLKSQKNPKTSLNESEAESLSRPDQITMAANILFPHLDP